MAEIKTVPEIGFGHRVPCPVRGLEILEDNSRVAVFARIVTPDIEIPLRRAFGRAARPLEPGVLIGGVIENQFGDDPQTAFMREVEEGAEVIQRAVAGIDGEIVGNVVAIVLERRWVEREQPQGGDAEFGEVIQPINETTEIADAIAIAILEGFDVKLVNDGAFEPKGIRH